MGENYEEQGVDPLLLEYLDLDTYTQRGEYLRAHREDLSDRVLDAMAMSHDIVLEEDLLFGKFEQLLKCVDMHAKYETNRFR